MIQALLASNILCLFISTEVTQQNPYILLHKNVHTFVKKNIWTPLVFFIFLRFLKEYFVSLIAQYLSSADAGHIQKSGVN